MDGDDRNPVRTKIGREALQILFTAAFEVR
jgi:hypothetical protein